MIKSDRGVETLKEFYQEVQQDGETDKKSRWYIFKQFTDSGACIISIVEIIRFLV